MVIGILTLTVISAMSSPIYIKGYVKEADPYWFNMDMTPQLIYVGEKVDVVAAVHYLFPYPFPWHIGFRVELDAMAAFPSNVVYYNTPPNSFRTGEPMWVNEDLVYYYPSVTLWRQGGGEVWIAFETTTWYTYDYHYGAVGDTQSLFWPVYDENYFVAEPRGGGR